MFCNRKLSFFNWWAYALYAAIEGSCYKDFLSFIDCVWVKAIFKTGSKKIQRLIKRCIFIIENFGIKF
jgi:hypothetical protein